MEKRAFLVGEIWFAVYCRGVFMTLFLQPVDLKSTMHLILGFFNLRVTRGS